MNGLVYFHPNCSPSWLEVSQPSVYFDNFTVQSMCGEFLHYLGFLTFICLAGHVGQNEFRSISKNAISEPFEARPSK